MSGTVNLDMGVDLRHRHLFLDTIVAGCIAGIVTESLLFPIESLKFCLQMGLPVNFRGLWKGYVPSVLGSGPTAAAFLYTYNTVKYYCQPHVADSHNYRVHLVAACVGEAVSLTVKVPADNVKHRRQVYSNPPSSLSFARGMLHHAGLRSFFAGYRSQVLSRVHSSIVVYPVWERLMARRKRGMGKEDLEPSEVAACGAVAAGMVGAITNPFDVARGHLVLGELKRLEMTRLQKAAELKIKEEAAKRLKAEKRLLRVEAKRVKLEQSQLRRREEEKVRSEGEKYRTLARRLRSEAKRFYLEESRLRGEAVLLNHEMYRLKWEAERVNPDLRRVFREFMMADRIPELYRAVGKIYAEKGIKRLFAGVVARTARITLGGAVFFYAYASAMDYMARQDSIEKLEVQAIVILESSEEKVEELIDKITTWNDDETVPDKSEDKPTDDPKNVVKPPEPQGPLTAKKLDGKDSAAKR